MKKIFLLCVLVASGSVRAGGAFLLGALGTSILVNRDQKLGNIDKEQYQAFVDCKFAGLVVGCLVGRVLSDFVPRINAFGIAITVFAMASYKLDSNYRKQSEEINQQKLQDNNKLREFNRQILQRKTEYLVQQARRSLPQRYRL